MCEQHHWNNYLARVCAVSILADPGRPLSAEAEVVTEAPGPGLGNWAAATSCVLVEGVLRLAYRVRRPLGEGPGVSMWS